MTSPLENLSGNALKYTHPQLSSTFSMAGAGWTPFPLWDKRHPDGGKPVILMPKYKDLVISKRVDLLKVVDPNTEFWSSLEALNVVDTATRDRLKVSINTAKTAKYLS